MDLSPEERSHFSSEAPLAVAFRWVAMVVGRFEQEPIFRRRKAGRP
jgi:hypothetical protein